MKFTELKNCKIAIIGLGYVGLPLAIEFGKKNIKASNIKLKIIWFDINKKRILSLKNNYDETHEIKSECFNNINHVIALTI